MSWWSTRKVTVANLDRVSPIADAIIGTEGEGTDINAAVTAGAKRIILLPGAILTADLSLTASDGFLVGFGSPSTIGLGAYQIDISGARWTLERFRLQGAAKSGIVVSGTAGLVFIDRVFITALTGASSHAIDLQSANADGSVITRVQAWSNGGDGLKIASGCNAVRAENNSLTSNTGYGVNDGSDASILVGNVLTGNTAGAINGTPDIDVGNKKT
jgi:hypothetical protein